MRLSECFTLVFCSLFSTATPATALCLTDSGLPTSSPADVVSNALLTHDDGSARYIHKLELADFDGDLILDVFLAIRDESYSGAPVFDFLYFKGAEEGWCGTSMASGLAALSDDVTIDLAPPRETEGYPTLRFTFDEVDVGKGTSERVVIISEYAEGRSAFAIERTAASE